MMIDGEKVISANNSDSSVLVLVWPTNGQCLTECHSCHNADDGV